MARTGLWLLRPAAADDDDDDDRGSTLLAAASPPASAGGLRSPARPTNGSAPAQAPRGAVAVAADAPSPAPPAGHEPPPRRALEYSIEYSFNGWPERLPQGLVDRLARASPLVGPRPHAFRGRDAIYSCPFCHNKKWQKLFWFTRHLLQNHC